MAILLIWTSGQICVVDNICTSENWHKVDFFGFIDHFEYQVLTTARRLICKCPLWFETKHSCTSELRPNPKAELLFLSTMPQPYTTQQYVQSSIPS